MHGDETLRGLYGVEPRVEAVTVLRQDLYRCIENDVRDWINEKRFIPRFLVAAAAFVVLFLFMSLVIRDPIPIIDELLIAGGGAAAAFIAIGRRFEHSNVATERRVALRTQVDRVKFQESEFVLRLEQLLRTIERAPEPVAIGRLQPDPEATALWKEFESETQEAYAYLRVLVGRKGYRALEKRLKRVGGDNVHIDWAQQGPSPAVLVLYHLLRISLP